uniref:Uncharacterized protein n=1 Tax=Rhizophora mucronata TaxID=61149 RepID=A0A2P2JBY4_RHIMU
MLLFHNLEVTFDKLISKLVSAITKELHAQGNKTVISYSSRYCN